MSQNLWNIDNSADCLAQGFAYYRWSINLSNKWANKDDKQKSLGLTMPGVSFRERWARSLLDALSNHCKGAGDCSLIANNKTKHKQTEKLGCRLHLPSLAPEDLDLVCCQEGIESFHPRCLCQTGSFLWTIKAGRVAGRNHTEECKKVQMNVCRWRKAGG